MCMFQFQKDLFNRLRLMIDLYMLDTTINESGSNNCEAPLKNRKVITEHISLEISKYSHGTDENLRPIKVRERLSVDELNELFLERSIAANGFECIDTSWGDLLVSDANISCSNHHELRSPSNHSLNDEEKALSPIEPIERTLSTVKEIEHKKPPVKVALQESSNTSQQSISILHLKLKAALNKARSSGTPVQDEEHVAQLPSFRVKSKYCSKSRSKYRSTISFDDTFVYPELPPEEAEPTELPKEQFLRLFGLYTHTFSDYLKARRLERKRRNCTSTARGDFHYGRLDLFENQYARKGNRQFLYSPPATRAIAKKRRFVIRDNVRTDPVVAAATAAATAAQAFRDNVFKAASIKSNVQNENKERVCVTCFKQSTLRSINSHKVTLRSIEDFQ